MSSNQSLSQMEVETANSYNRFNSISDKVSVNDRMVSKYVEMLKNGATKDEAEIAVYGTRVVMLTIRELTNLTSTVYATDRVQKEYDAYIEKQRKLAMEKRRQLELEQRKQVAYQQDLERQQEFRKQIQGNNANIPHDDKYPIQTNYIFGQLNSIDGARFRRSENGVKGNITNTFMNKGLMYSTNLDVDFDYKTMSVAVRGTMSEHSSRGTNTRDMSQVVMKNPNGVKTLVDNITNMQPKKV